MRSTIPNMFLKNLCTCIGEKVGEEFPGYLRGSVKCGTAAETFPFSVLSKMFSVNMYSFFNQKETQQRYCQLYVYIKYNLVYILNL